MNILVCISSVPDTTSPIKFKNENRDFENSGINFIINPYDEFCLTKAIFLKEKSNASITVINVGENTNDPILRKALAIGADKAVRINQKSTNSKIVAECIASYCSDKSFDLIFCGRESIDYNGGQVPGFLAIKLNIPFLKSLKTAMGMSIIAMISMEIAMNATDYVLTGGAILNWWIVPIMLTVGFLTPWPYNYWRLKKYNQTCH